MKVGLVGLGRMGAAIAQRLNERGCEIVAWDRNPKAREAQAKRGLRIVDNPRAVANAADVVLSIITEDKGVRQIFAGPRVSGEPARHRLIPPLTRGLIDRDHRGEPTKAAGSLFPQPRVATADGRIALLDDILPPAFLVVSGSVDAQAALSDRELEVLRRLGAVRVVLRLHADGIAADGRGVMTLAAKDELFANWLVETGATAAVVRPDRYVYGVAGSAPDLARLVGVLGGAMFG